MATVRYLVHDVGKAIDFYCGFLGFVELERYGPAMAIVTRKDLKLWLAGPPSSAAKPMPNGDKPQPGGWNRLVLEVEDLATTASQLKAAGARFRNEPLSGPGGQQVLIEDPSGNPVELFQPA